MKLRTENFKGVDHNLTLGDRTLLAGPCGTGKSTVSDALTWLFLGHLPRLGKRLDASAELMRGREMAVELTLDDGRTITRTLSTKKSGSLTMDVRCSWLPDGAGQDEHEAACLALVGTDAESAAEALDVRSLINATGPRRTQRIQQMLSAGAMGPDARVKLVAEFVARRLTGMESRADVGLAELVPLIPGTGKDGQPHTGVRRILGEAQAELRSSIVDGGFANAKAWAGGEKNRAAKEAREKKAALAELEARVSELAEVDAEGLAEDEQRLREIDEAIGAERREAEQHAAKVERYAAAERKVAEAKRVVADAEAQVEATKAAAETRKAAEKRRDEIKAKLGALAEPTPKPMPQEAADCRETARWAREQADQIDCTEPDQRALREAQWATTRAEEALTRAEADPWCQVVEKARWLIDGIGEYVKKEDAREQMQAACSELVVLAEAQGYADEDALRREIDKAKAAVAEARAAYDKAMEAHRANVAERDRLRREAVGLENRATKLENDVKAANVAAVDAWIAEHGQSRADLGDELARLEIELAKPAPSVDLATEKAARARDNLTAAEEALAAIGEKPADEAPVVDTSERDRLKASIDDKRATQAKRDELRRMADALAKADAEREVYAAIEWACTQAIGREAQDASRALLDPMRTFLRAAGRDEDPFCEATGSDFRIGWRKPDGAEVSVKTLCGGEWPVFVAALSAAMHSHSAAPIKLVLAEAGETDDAHLAQILRGLGACEGVRAIVAVQRTITTEPTGWTLVRTDAADASAEAA